MAANSLKIMDLYIKEPANSGTWKRMALNSESRLITFLKPITELHHKSMWRLASEVRRLAAADGATSANIRCPVATLTQEFI